MEIDNTLINRHISTLILYEYEAMLAYIRPRQSLTEWKYIKKDRNNYISDVAGGWNEIMIMLRPHISR